QLLLVQSPLSVGAAAAAGSQGSRDVALVLALRLGLLPLGRVVAAALLHAAGGPAVGLLMGRGPGASLPVARVELPANVGHLPANPVQLLLLLLQQSLALAQLMPQGGEAGAFLVQRLLALAQFVLLAGLLLVEQAHTEDGHGADADCYLEGADGE